MSELMIITTRQRVNPNTSLGLHPGMRKAYVRIRRCAWIRNPAVRGSRASVMFKQTSDVCVQTFGKKLKIHISCAYMFYHALNVVLAYFRENGFP